LRGKLPAARFRAEVAARAIDIQRALRSLARTIRASVDEDEVTLAHSRSCWWCFGDFPVPAQHPFNHHPVDRAADLAIIGTFSREYLFNYRPGQHLLDGIDPLRRLRGRRRHP